MVIQKEITITEKKRGFHIITKEVLSVVPKKTGLIHVFIKHTSASLTINENADPSVRFDFENHFNLLVSEKEKHYTHTFEGPDDMTSHIKSSLLGSSVSFPVKGGSPCLGAWQGVYLCEHRNNSHVRNIIATINGEKF